MFIGVNEEKSLFLLEFSAVMLQDILLHVQKCQCEILRDSPQRSYR